jgi:hypothetical protein
LPCAVKRVKAEADEQRALELQRQWGRLVRERDNLRQRIASAQDQLARIRENIPRLRGVLDNTIGDDFQTRRLAECLTAIASDERAAVEVERWLGDRKAELIKATAALEAFAAENGLEDHL